MVLPKRITDRMEISILLYAIGSEATAAMNPASSNSARRSSVKNQVCAPMPPTNALPPFIDTIVSINGGILLKRETRDSPEKLCLNP
jgi:hypothetical protein